MACFWKTLLCVPDCCRCRSFHLRANDQTIHHGGGQHQGGGELEVALKFRGTQYLFGEGTF